MRNIEIKAKVDDPNVLISRINELTDSNYVIIKQHDTFFKTIADGRLKLRQFEDNTGELIFYKRTNALGPKLSSYEKTLLTSEASSGITKVLTESNGCIGIVKKIRRLYMIGQTRVHVDEVEGLGSFMELEVVLNDDQDVQSGEKIAEDIMTQLGVKEQDLIAEAYIDLLQKGKIPT